MLLLAAVAAVTNRVRGERLAFLPGTALGWWAVAIIFGVALSVGAGQIQATGHVENDLLEDTTLVVGLAASIVAIVAVLKRGERSIPVIVLALLPVMSVAYFLFGELALAL